MFEPQTAQLLYVCLFAIILLGPVVSQARQAMGPNGRSLVAWCLILVSTATVFNFRSDIQRAVNIAHTTQTGEGEVSLGRRLDGHYMADIAINGVILNFIVDTGASSIVLSQQDATRIGLDPETLNYDGEARTANGTVALATIRLRKMQLGQFIDENVTAVVNMGDHGTSLLGLSYLDRFEEIIINKDAMVLHR